MSGDAPEELEVVERYEISDDEDDFEYGTIDDEENLGLDDEDDDDEDLATALASLAKTKDASATVSPTKTTETRDKAARIVTQVRPSVVDDFIRNFLIKVGMTRTLDAFNTEWYELQSKGKLNEEYTSTVPDIYLRNQQLGARAAHA